MKKRNKITDDKKAKWLLAGSSFCEMEKCVFRSDDFQDPCLILENVQGIEDCKLKQTENFWGTELRKFLIIPSV